MNYQIPPLRRAILAAGAVIATAGPAVLFAAPASAAPTITFTGGVLTINSDAGNNALVVGQTPAQIVTLNGSPVLGGTVPVADVQVVRMNGGAGDDVVSPGDGSDQFTWNPGDGNDHVDGNAGKDTLIFNGSDGTPSAPFATETLRFLSDGTRSTIIRQLFPDAPSRPSEMS